MRRLLCAAALLLAACRPDQIEHLKDSKRIAVEAENWQVKRILPTDLLRATRWAGDSLTGYADSLLRRTLARELAAGGVARAAPFCRPEHYPAVDSLANVLKANPERVEWEPGLAAPGPRPDTTRTIARPSTEVFFYQRPIPLSAGVCLRCHGSVEAGDLSAADAELLRTQFPKLQATGRRRGELLGAWQVTLQRTGVAEFWTMKKRKVFKRRF